MLPANAPAPLDSTQPASAASSLDGGSVPDTDSSTLGKGKEAMNPIVGEASPTKPLVTGQRVSRQARERLKGPTQGHSLRERTNSPIRGSPHRPPQGENPFSIPYPPRIGTPDPLITSGGRPPPHLAALIRRQSLDRAAQHTSIKPPPLPAEPSYAVPDLVHTGFYPPGTQLVTEDGLPMTIHHCANAIKPREVRGLPFPSNLCYPYCRACDLNLSPDKPQPPLPKKDTPPKNAVTTRLQIAGLPSNVFVTKFGAHSVNVGLCTQYHAQRNASKGGQNVLERIRQMLAQTADAVSVTADFDVALTQVLALQTIQTPHRYGAVTSTFERWSEVEPAPFYISLPDSAPRYDLDVSNATRYIDASGVPNFKQVANALVSDGNFHHRLAEMLVGSFTSMLGVVDNSTFYAYGCLLAYQLSAYEESGRRYRLRPYVEGAFVLRDVGASQNLDALASAIISDIALGRLVFFVHQLCLEDLQVIAHLASGYPRFEDMPTQHESWHSLASTIHAPTIPVAFYYSGEPPLIPRTGLTVEKILSALNRIAHLRVEAQDLLHGWMRSATMWFGRFTSVGERRKFVTAILEFGGVYWPKPRDHNFMWRLVRTDPLPSTDSSTIAEANTLCLLTAPEFEQASAALAGIMSVGVGSAFHGFNLGGYELSGYACHSNTYSRPRELITRLSTVDRSSQLAVPVIMTIAVAAVKQFSNMTIDAHAWRCAAWSGNYHHVPTEDLKLSWAGMWGHCIPYVVSPLSVAWAFTSWLDIWGLFSPPVDYNLTAEVVRAAIPGVAGWYPDQDAAAYSKLPSSPANFIFAPYGAIVLNVLLQQFDVRRIIPITFREWAPTAKGHASVLRGDSMDYQPTYVSELRTILPGTLRSYRWDKDLVLEPTLRHAHMPQEMWLALRQSPATNTDNAGIFLPSLEVAEDKHVQAWTLDEICPIVGDPAEAKAHSGDDTATQPPPEGTAPPSNQTEVKQVPPAPPDPSTGKSSPKRTPRKSKHKAKDKPSETQAPKQEAHTPPDKPGVTTTKPEGPKQAVPPAPEPEN